MSIKEALERRLIEGLAPYAEANELKVLHDKLTGVEDVPALADTIHSYYGELLTRRELPTTAVEGVAKPKNANELVYWIEELEDAVLVELQRYLEN